MAALIILIVVSFGILNMTPRMIVNGTDVRFAANLEAPLSADMINAQITHTRANGVVKLRNLGTTPISLADIVVQGVVSLDKNISRDDTMFGGKIAGQGYLQPGQVIEVSIEGSDLKIANHSYLLALIAANTHGLGTDLPALQEPSQVPI